MSESDTATLGIARSHSHYDEIKDELDGLAWKVLHLSTISSDVDIDVEKVTVTDRKIEFELRDHEPD